MVIGSRFGVDWGSDRAACATSAAAGRTARGRRRLVRGPGECRRGPRRLGELLAPPGPNRPVSPERWLAPSSGWSRQRPVEHVQQRVVLPEATREGDRQGGRTDDQPRAELIQMVDDAQAILMPDGPYDLRHRAPLPSGRARSDALMRSRERRQPDADEIPAARRLRSAARGTGAEAGPASPGSSGRSARPRNRSPVIESLNSRRPPPSCCRAREGASGRRSAERSPGRRSDRWWDYGTLRPRDGCLEE